MRWADLTPLFSLILCVLAVLSIVLLAVMRVEIPGVLVTIALTTGAAFGITSGQRGSTPPGAGGDGHGG